MKNLYNIYGPDASDEIGVLFIEVSANTTSADLQGTGSSTYGNWIAGTPYPIIDDASVASTLQIGYYPTIYGVCPDGKIYEFGQRTADQLVSLFESKCNYTVGVTEFKIESLEVYPNPTHDKLNIEFEIRKVSEVSIKLHNLLGQTILSENKNLSDGHCKIQLDVSEFNSGIYLLDINNESESKTHKIIIR